MKGIYPILVTDVFAFVVLTSFWDQRSRSQQVITRKTGWIQYMYAHYERPATCKFYQFDHLTKSHLPHLIISTYSQWLLKTAVVPV